MVSAGEEARRTTSLGARIARLVRDFSIEVLPREADRAAAAARLRPGTRVYLTRLPKAPFDTTLRAAKRVRELGLEPVPHVTARAIVDLREFREQLAALAGEADVREILLVAGSQSEPAGAFEDTLQVLASGAFERAGIARIGLAGHPEGLAGVDDVRLQAALDFKNEFARESGLELYLVTQFFFDTGPVIRWERRIRELGNRLPVRVGFHGSTGAAALLKHALACGIGTSINVLAQHASLLQLAVVRSPDRLLVEIAQASLDDEDALFAGAHFFPLGGFERTAAWANAIAAGNVRVEANGSLTVGG